MPGSTSAALPRRSIRAEAVILALLLVGAAAARLLALDRVPPGLYCDEAAIAVNARSLALTGRDTSGRWLPLYPEETSFAALGGRSIVYQPVYVYLSAPFAGLLGFTPFATRLPSALFGVAAVWAAYALARRLFGRAAALLSALFLAFFPWHLHFSRVAFEAISLPFLLAVATWLLWQGLRSRGRLVAGAALLALTTYAYPTAKLFAPLLAAGFAWIHFRRLRERPRPALLALGVFVAVGLPNLALLVSGRQQQRVGELMIFTADLREERAVAFLEARGDGGWAGAVLGSRVLKTAFVFAYNYVAYLSPGFLFFEGDPNLRHHPRWGGMYPLAALPLAVAGLAVLVRRRNDPRHRFLLFWILAGPLPASLTIQGPHAIRAMNLLPAFEIVCALGALALVAAARTLRLPETRAYWPPWAAAGALAVSAVTAPLEAAGYLRHTFREYPVYSASWWQYGTREALALAGGLRRPGEPIVLSRRLTNPYLDARYFAEGDDVRVADGASTPRGLWIVVAEEAERLDRSRVIGRVPYPDGRPNLVLVRLGP